MFLLAIANVMSTELEDAAVSQPENVEKLLLTYTPLEAWLLRLTKANDWNKKVAEAGGSIESVFKDASTSLGPWGGGKLPLAMPDGMIETDKKNLIVIREGTLNTSFTFKTGRTYTAAVMNADRKNVEWELATPGHQVPLGDLLQTQDDSGNAVQAIVRQVAPNDDGTNLIIVEITTGTLADAITNSTAKTLQSLGPHNAEKSKTSLMPGMSSSSETFNFAQIQRTISVTAREVRTTYDSLDQLPFSVGKYLQCIQTMLKEIDRALFVSTGGSLVDKDNNTFSAPTGILNTTGIGTTSATSINVGPKFLRNLVDPIIHSPSAQVNFDFESDLPIIDLFCDSVRVEMFDDMLRTSTKFGSQIYNTPGTDKYNVNMKTFVFRDALIRINRQWGMDDGPYATRCVAGNMNAIRLATKKGFFFTVRLDTSLSTANEFVFVVTLVYCQPIALKTMFRIGTNMTAIATS